MWAREPIFVQDPQGRWIWWAGRESNPHSRKTADLQSAELTTCSTYPWSRRWDSNPGPAVYKTAALPVELRRLSGWPRLALAANEHDRSPDEFGSSTGWVRLGLG